MWCSGQGVGLTRVSRVRLPRHYFLYLCTFSFQFSVWPFFNTTFPFGLFFSLFLLLTLLLIHSDQYPEFYFGKGISKAGKALDLHTCTGQAYDQKKKKHKLSRHVPPLKQLNFFSMLVEIMTNNTQYTTNCTNLHPTPTSDPLAKVKLAFCTSS